MSVTLKAVSDEVKDIPLQDASLDIWDKKYRLESQDWRGGRRRC